jgi:hypothetical protein
MRPVNLIPNEERLGAQRPLRSGPTAYIVVGALVAALLGVTALVTTGSRIDDLKGEVTQVEGEIATAEAAAQELSAYTQFRSVPNRGSRRSPARRQPLRLGRVIVVCLVLPNSVTDLTPRWSGVAPAGGSAALRASVAGPALSMTAAQPVGQGRRVRAGTEGHRGGDPGLATSSQGSGGAERTPPAQAAVNRYFCSVQMIVAFDAAPAAATSVEAAPEVAASSPESEATAEE